MNDEDQPKNSTVYGQICALVMLCFVATATFSQDADTNLHTKCDEPRRFNLRQFAQNGQELPISGNEQCDSEEIASWGIPAVPTLVKLLRTKNLYWQAVALQSIKKMGASSSGVLPALLDLRRSLDRVDILPANVEKLSENRKTPKVDLLAVDSALLAIGSAASPALPQMLDSINDVRNNLIIREQTLDSYLKLAKLSGISAEEVLLDQVGVQRSSKELMEFSVDLLSKSEAKKENISLVLERNLIFWNSKKLAEYFLSVEGKSIGARKLMGLCDPEGQTDSYCQTVAETLMPLRLDPALILQIAELLNDSKSIAAGFYFTEKLKIEDPSIFSIMLSQLDNPQSATRSLWLVDWYHIDLPRNLLVPILLKNLKYSADFDLGLRNTYLNAVNSHALLRELPPRYLLDLLESDLNAIERARQQMENSGTAQNTDSLEENACASALYIYEGSENELGLISAIRKAAHLRADGCVAHIAGALQDINTENSLTAIAEILFSGENDGASTYLLSMLVGNPNLGVPIALKSIDTLKLGALAWAEMIICNKSKKRAEPKLRESRTKSTCRCFAYAFWTRWRAVLVQGEQMPLSHRPFAANKRWFGGTTYCDSRFGRA